MTARISKINGSSRFVGGGRQTPITGQMITGVLLERNGKCERRSSSSLSR
jgi:hypothetical protein